MKKLLRTLYVLIGKIFLKSLSVYWGIRDVIVPFSGPVLFVAHPDDDTLFFHNFIIEEKPYVILMTTGWSLRRLPGFLRAMRYYGVRCKAYDTPPINAASEEIRYREMEKIVNNVLKNRGGRLLI